MKNTNLRTAVNIRTENGASEEEVLVARTFDTLSEDSEMCSGLDSF